MVCFFSASMPENWFGHLGDLLPYQHDSDLIRKLAAPGVVTGATQHQFQRVPLRLVLALNPLPFEESPRSAFSEPTRLSVPLLPIRKALYQKSCGICCLYCVRFSSNAVRAGTPGFLSSITTQGRPLTKPTRSGRQV